MTADELKTLFPHASAQFIRTNASDRAPRPASTPEPKRRAGDGPLGAPQAQASHSGKYVVRVTSFRVRLLDTDNLVPKWHVDALRYAGVLPSDAPDRCEIETKQKKVSAKAEERTEILIEKLP